ncbi:MAG: hypothetical protein JNK64_39315 [Myxococcales bacterium]|nr:hypothetical protein [Myxococcales bacterium]
MRPAVLIALALGLGGPGCKDDPPAEHRAAVRAPTAPADVAAAVTAPRLRAQAATATFDATTRALRLAGLATIDVRDARGEVIYTTTPAELAALHDEASAARGDATVPTSVSVAATDGDGRAFASAHELEAIRVDAATATTTLVLRAAPTLATLPATMTRPAIVMGTAPQAAVCCGCDGACLAGWALGTCATCSAEADACCAACGLPAADGDVCL